MPLCGAVFMRPLAVAALTTLAALPAAAQSGSDPFGLFGDRWQVGGLVYVSPKFEGAKSYQVTGFPFVAPAGVGDNGIVQIKGADDIRFRVLQFSNFEVGPLAGYRFGRDQTDADAPDRHRRHRRRLRARRLRHLPRRPARLLRLLPPPGDRGRNRRPRSLRRGGRHAPVTHGQADHQHRHQLRHRRLHDRLLRRERAAVGGLGPACLQSVGGLQRCPRRRHRRASTSTTAGR